MARQPVVGADSNAWGTILNAYLSVAHNADGSIKNLMFNVTDPAYGADPTGTNDSTTAINNAITAAASGGIVYFPPGTYKTSGSLVITADNIILQGAGWGTVIKPASGAQFDVISTAIPASAGLSGFIRNYLGIVNLMIDCSNMTGTTAGQGNAIHWYGVRYSYIRDVYVKSCQNWAILLDGDNTGPGNNFGYDCQVFRCVFDLCNAGIWNTNTEAHDIIGNRFKWAGTATAAAQPALGTQDTNALHLRCSGGYMSITNNVFGKGGTYTTEAIRLSNSGPCKVIGNRFDQVRNQAVILNGGNHIFMGNQLGSPGSAISGVAGIQIGSSKNTIVGNKFDITAGAMNATYAISESGGPFADNLIADNNLLTGTTGFINQNATSTNKVHHNAGYNPVGFAVAQPAVPASTVNATNNSGVDCMVHIAGGTLTVVTVGGTATGITAAAAAGSVHTVRVPAGQTINITYTVAPTWKWYGD